MLCPGLLWAHKGYMARAFWVNLLFIAVWVAYLFAWIWWKFHPTVPSAWLFGGWLLLMLFNARDADRAMNLVDVPPSSTFLGVFAITTWFGLILGLASYTTGSVASVVTMRSASMFPTSLPGDVMVVDRSVFYMSRPRIGDVVMYRAPGEHMLRVARIVGLPDDLIRFEHGELIGSRYTVSQGTVDGDYAQAFQRATGMSPDMAGARFEAMGQKVYTVAGTQGTQASESFNGREWHVGPNELFVLNDNRGHIDDSRVFGAIPLRNIVGMPIFVLQSKVKDDALRRARSGSVLQQPRSIDMLRREAAALQSLEHRSD